MSLSGTIQWRKAQKLTLTNLKMELARLIWIMQPDFLGRWLHKHKMKKFTTSYITEGFIDNSTIYNEDNELNPLLSILYEVSTLNNYTIIYLEDRDISIVTRGGCYSPVVKGRIKSIENKTNSVSIVAECGQTNNYMKNFMVPIRITYRLNNKLGIRYLTSAIKRKSFIMTIDAIGHIIALWIAKILRKDWVEIIEKHQRKYAYTSTIDEFKTISERYEEYTK